MVQTLIKSSGKKSVCGGTAANIVAREMDVEIEASLNYINLSIPPVAMSKERDLVIEGVLTIKGAIEILKDVKVKSQS